jgi:hypothetical protein
VAESLLVCHIQRGVTRRSFLVCGTLLLSMATVARGGSYQPTRNGKSLVWNDHPKAGDEATWSGERDRNGYARGFGRLVWYTKEPDSSKPQLYARYWGRMVEGKFEGPVNVHSKRKTHYAIFVDGVRVTHWAPGTAPSRATAQWRTIASARQRIASEPESPAEGPTQADIPSRSMEFISSARESIRDLTRERWPTIDIDDSLRVLALPPRSLRGKP